MPKEIIFFKTILPKSNDMRFDDLIDLTTQKAELKGIQDYVLHPEKFQNGIFPYSKLLFSGPSGVGKKSLAIALAGELSIPIIITNHKFFFQNKLQNFLERLTCECQKFEKCIVFVDTIEYVLQFKEEEKRFMFFEGLADFFNHMPNLIAIVSNSVTCTFPSFFFEEGNFEKSIAFQLPELKVREKLFQKFCQNLSIDPSVNFKFLAKDTLNFSGGLIKKVINTAYLISIDANRTSIMQSDFDDVISKIMYGGKRKKPSDAERLITAYHETGHALVGYYSGINYISKIDIIHRDESLGITLFAVDEEKYSWTKEDYLMHVYCALGGLAAEELLLRTHSSGVSQDLEQATDIVVSLICSFGMDDTIGPICLFPEDYVFSALSEAADFAIQQTLKDALKKARKILKQHKKELKNIAQALLENEVISFEEMLTIIKNS